jgi:uncharacterized membrane protein HdeD (DUF308 family)
VKRGTMAWFRYRMISGAIFSLLGIVIAVELVLRPGPMQSKIAGFGFAIVAIALGVVRIVQYVQARSTPGTRQGQ